jgi:hypothetical protein
MSYSGSLSKISNANLDCQEGIFKYIQIHCEDMIANESNIVIRAFKGCEYHPDILDLFNGKIKIFI